MSYHIGWQSFLDENKLIPSLEYWEQRKLEQRQLNPCRARNNGQGERQQSEEGQEEDFEADGTNTDILNNDRKNNMNEG